MPYKQVWVKPKVFMRYKGVTIYHTYKDDESNNGPSMYYYSTSEQCSDEGMMSFDVRELPNWLECPQPAFIDLNAHHNTRRALSRKWDQWFKDKTLEQHIKFIIRAAISAGRITKGDDDE
jgi:hypothetical protein